MRLDRLTQYLLGHRWQALLLTFLITYIPLLGMAGIVIAGLFTLSVGVFEGALFTIAASLPYVAAVYGLQPDALTPMIWLTVILTVSGNILTYVFAVMLRRGSSWSQLVQLAALFGVFVICMIHYFYPGIANWWDAQLQVIQSKTMSMAVSAGKLQIPAPPVKDAVLTSNKWVTPCLTGMVMAFVLLTALIQVAVSRWWQMLVINHASVSRELQTIRLSPLTGYLFILALVLYYLENQIVLDILPVLCLLFGAAGLSLVHNLCTIRGASQGRQWLYVALIASLFMLAMTPFFAFFRTTVPMMLAALMLFANVFVFILLSLLDIWLDLRTRAQKT